MEFAECNQHAKCRDFLHDIVNSSLTHESFFIYGMEYLPEDHPIDLDVCRLGLKFPSEKMKDLFVKNLPILFKLESDGKLSISSVYDTNNPTYLIVEGDKYWQHSSLAISMYSFFLRLLCYDVSAETFQDLFTQVSLEDGEDSRYIAKITLNKAIEVYSRLPDLIMEVFNGWEKEINQSHVFHDYSGIVSLFADPKHHYIPIPITQNLHYQELVKRGLINASV